MAELAFDTTVNYQKIYLQGTVPITVANPSQKISATITHSLGYIPNVRVWFTNASGKLCPASGSIMGTYLSGITSDFNLYACYYRVNSTTLTVTLDRGVTVGATATSTIYYRIYMDSI